MTTDDVIELEARERGVDSSLVTASARTTVVPNARAGRAYDAVPATLAIRSSNGAAGVAPVMFKGSGRVGDTHTTVDFLFQAPTNQNGPVSFGERDEYRLEVVSDRYGAKLGDHVFGFSQLLSTGTMGTGAEVRTLRGALTGGAYAQRPRWSPETSGEQGAFVSAGRDSSIRATATAMLRQSSAGGSVAATGLDGVLRAFGNTFEVEGAMSDSMNARGVAYRARVSHTSDRLNYEAGISQGDRQFAGPFRGWTSQGASLSAQLTKSLSVSANGRISEWGGNDTATFGAGERLSMATGSASWHSATVEYGWLGRRGLAETSAAQSTQRGVRFLTTRNIKTLSITAGAERGTVYQSDSTRERPYAQASLSLSTSAGKYGSLGVSAIYSHGNTLTGLKDGIADVGVNTTLRLPFGFEFGVAGSARRASMGVLDSSGAWFSVMDARLDKRVTNGSVIGMHARTMQSPYTTGAATGNSRALYLEYRKDLNVPLKASREHGRAIGRVVNEGDGTPVAGALVRLGSEAAITDREGRVWFSGLERKQYRVSLEATGAAAGAMIVGDVVVDLSGDEEKPREFRVSVVRGARVTASLRQMTRRGSVGDAAGELTDAGAVAGMLVKLSGARDTVFQMSDERGVVDFGAVAPGRYVLSVRATDAPAQTRFEQEQVEITATPGEKVAGAFRLLPRERVIRMIEAGSVKVETRNEKR